MLSLLFLCIDIANGFGEFRGNFGATSCSPPLRSTTWFPLETRRKVFKDILAWGARQDKPSPGRLSGDTRLIFLYDGHRVQIDGRGQAWIDKEIYRLNRSALKQISDTVAWSRLEERDGWTNPLLNNLRKKARRFRAWH